MLASDVGEQSTNQIYQEETCRTIESRCVGQEILSEKARNNSSPSTVNVDFIPVTNDPNISQNSSNLCLLRFTVDICLHQRRFKIFLNIECGGRGDKTID